MGKKQPQVPQQIIDETQRRYAQTLQPSANEQELAGLSGSFMDNYNQAVQQNTKDYGDIMGAYQNFRSGLGGPSNFSFRKVTAKRPDELGESYGYLREAAPGYREFASTGGYSPTDIQELRARGISPIRSAYGNTMRELDRARSLGGSAGAPNYIAAVSRAQRELPEQMASATTDVNARLAEDVRQGKLAGLAGLTGIGGTMGGLSSAEAGRTLQADLSNQDADLKAQQMREQSLQNLRASQLASIGGQASLYGTTPGMSSMFGNQALGMWQNRLGAENTRHNLGMALLDAQLRSYGVQEASQGTPWWKTALGVAATVAPYVAMAASSRELKEDIKPVSKSRQSKIAKYVKELPLYTWKYKGDDTTHFGPIAEEFKDKFGIGDGKTIHLADIMGVMLASAKS